MSKLAFRAQAVDIAYLPVRQDLLAKNVLMTGQRDSRLGNSWLRVDHSATFATFLDAARPGRRLHRALRFTKARSGPGINADLKDFKHKELIG
jgi:hypothetical protein